MTRRLKAKGKCFQQALVTDEVCRRTHKSRSRCTAETENHTGSLLSANNRKPRLQFSLAHKNWMRRLSSFCLVWASMSVVTFWMLKSVFGVSSMKAWIHPACISSWGSCWWCVDICSASFKYRGQPEYCCWLRSSLYDHSVRIFDGSFEQRKLL